MTRVWLDTEFIEDGRTIDLLSIGLVREDGETYYAEPAETDRLRADPWVAENVLPNLTGPVKPRAQIATEVVDFVGPRPEFWAWYADYDWVALCQLYGRMIDLPDGWPMFCRDYKQIAPVGTKQLDGNHNALADAQWLRATMLAARPVPAATHTDTAAQAGAQVLRDAIEALTDLPGTDATGYYAGEQHSGYNEAVRHVEAMLTARADRLVAQAPAPTPSIDAAHLARQREWSERTFGPGRRTGGVCDHIRKELKEVEADPGDVREWVDVVILALDGAWRTGAEPQQIIDAIRAKQERNESRTWPDWRTMSEDQAIEHVRDGDA